MVRRPAFYGGGVRNSIIMHLHTTELVLFLIYMSLRKYCRLTCGSGRPGLVVTRVSCNRGLADKTANANYSAKTTACSSIYLRMSCVISPF